MIRHPKGRRLILAIVLVAAMSFASFLGTAGHARADVSTIPWGEETAVAASATGTGSSYSRVLLDNQGHLFVFYETVTGVNQANVSVSKYLLSPIAPPAYQYTRSVNGGDMSAAAGTFLSVAIDSGGRLYAAWTKSALYTSGHGAEVFVSMSANGGNTWTQVAQVSAPSSYGDNVNPSLAVNPADGSVWVAWDQSWAGSYNISISHSVDHGASFSGFTNITDEGSTLAIWPQLGIDSHGRMYVLFENQTSVSGAPYSLYWTWSDGGTDWAAPSLMPSYVTGAFTPTLAVDSSDRIHVAWYDWRLVNGERGVHYRMSANRGATWTADVPVNQGTILPGNFPSLAIHGNTVIVLWASNSGGPGLGYAISTDGGLSFAHELFTDTSTGASLPGGLAADANDTFFASYSLSTTPNSIAFKIWAGPPSAPTITSVAAAARQLTVSWSPAPEPNVAEYRVYRSADGSTYQAVASLGAATTSYVDAGLANGTYWYYVVAVNVNGVSSLPSAAWSGVVGPSIAQLQSELTNLQAQLGTANANLASIQTQLNAIKGQVSSLQGNTTALQDQINTLQNQLNAAQTTAYANLAFEIIVVVLLAALLFFQMRKPKSPQMMMAQPGQAQTPPKQPEDDL